VSQEGIWLLYLQVSTAVDKKGSTEQLSALSSELAAFTVFKKQTQPQ